jgi:cell division transport system ATP-binding protein
MTGPDAEIVRFDNVGLRYGTDKEVLTDISFTLFPGTFYFLTGASGAGKTSLLKLLYLALRPSRGMIRMFGTDAITLPRERLPGFRRRLGVVFQDFRLVQHLSAFDNIALPLRVAGVPEADLARPVADMRVWVGLGERTRARRTHAPGAGRAGRAAHQTPSGARLTWRTAANPPKARSERPTARRTGAARRGSRPCRRFTRWISRRRR